MIALILSLLLFVLPGDSTAPGDVDVMLVHVNQARVDAGVAPLVWKAELTWAEGAHVEDMASRGYFAHLSPEGFTPSDRAMRQGYGYYVAENIVKCYQGGAAEAARLLLGSPKHRRSLLSPDFQDIGLWTAPGVDGCMYAGIMVGAT